MNPVNLVRTVRWRNRGGGLANKKRFWGLGEQDQFDGAPGDGELASWRRRGGAPRSVRTHPEPGVNPKNVMNVVVVAGGRDGDDERFSVSVVAVPSVVDLPSLTSARVSSSVSTDHPAQTPRTEPPSAASGSSRDESPLESEL